MIDKKSTLYYCAIFCSAVSDNLANWTLFCRYELAKVTTLPHGKHGQNPKMVLCMVLRWHSTIWKQIKYEAENNHKRWISNKNIIKLITYEIKYKYELSRGI